MRGRRPKPTALHRLEGTFSPVRHGRGRAGEPMPADLDDSEPPIDLTDDQAAIWRDCLANAPANIVKKIDRKVLGVFVEAADRHNTARMMQAILDSNAQLKLLTKGAKGSLVASPYNKILDRTADTILRAADRLGFCPTARPRLKTDDAPAAPAADDAWAPLRLKVLPGGRAD
jgi:hypothetical protein